MQRALLALLTGSILGLTFAFAAPVEVIPADFVGAIQPQIALGADGRIHLVFGQGSSLFYVTSKDGTTFSTPARVATLEKLALGMRRGPRIAVSKNLLLITAISHVDGNVHAWTSPDGANWQEQRALNQVPLSAREGLHALAGNGQNRIGLTWLDLRTGKMSLWGKFSEDGGLHWGEDRLVYASPEGPICQCCAPSVAFAPDGRIGIMWRNLLQGARDLYLTETKDGVSFSPPLKLGQGSWMLNACPMDGGGLTYDQNSQGLPVWKRLRAVFSSENPTIERMVAESAAQPVATFVGKTPLVFWESKGALMLQRGNAAPQTYAVGGQYAAVASQGITAVVAFEGLVRGRKTILCELQR